MWRYFRKIAIPIIKVVVRIIVIVISALLCEPIAMNTRARPKKIAAERASSTGFSGNPCETSGPLAKKPPISAAATPMLTIVES